MGDSALRLEVLEPRWLLNGTALPEVNLIPTVVAATEQNATPGEFIITRSGSTDVPLTVYFSLGGTATPELDYVSPGNSVTIPAGLGSAKFQITPVDDTLNEGNETVAVILQTDPAYTLGEGISDSIIIVDNDNPDLPRGAIGGFVFDDRDGDGVKTTDEFGILGVTVELLLDVNGDGRADEGDLSLAINTTNSAGWYEFPVLDSTNYLVRITDEHHLLDALLLSTAGTTLDVHLQKDQVIDDFDFGYFNPDQLVFGNVSGQGNVKKEFRGVTYSLRGPGQGTIQINPNDTLNLILNGTTPQTHVKLKVAGKTLSALNDVRVNGSVGTMDLRQTDLLGDYRSIGSTRKLLTDDIRNAEIDIGIGVRKSQLFLRATNVKDTLLVSHVAVQKLLVKTWENTDEYIDEIFAPSAGQVISHNDFQANLSLTNTNIGTSLKKLQVGKMLSNATIRTASNIGTVTLGAMDGAKIFAGVRDSIADMPAGTEDFADPTSRIRKVVLRGVRHVADEFVASTIAAGQIDKLKLNQIQTANDGNSFGIIADTIGSVRFSLDQARTTLTHLDDAVGSTTHEDFVLRLVDSLDL